MGDIFTGTPPGLTYDHEIVRQAWMTVWAITSGALMAILGWMGLSFIVQEHLGRHQSGWREMVPRLVLGLTAAASSLWWCALVIAVAHAVSQFIAVELDVTPGALLRAPLEPLLTAVETANTGLAVFIALLYLVFGFFVLYLLVRLTASRERSTSPPERTVPARPLLRTVKPVLPCPSPTGGRSTRWKSRRTLRRR